MDMQLSSPVGDVQVGLIMAALWLFPVGAFVMRRHFLQAEGARLVARNVIYGMAIVTFPFAASLIGIFLVRAAHESFRRLHSLISVAW